ncbi:MAG: hypothetical protein CM15mP122_4580 [Bacteroidota bacterium]|nr:MAG: hypothetical protein CM15mP122_4580 [Bacteroidota bacterium]
MRGLFQNIQLLFAYLFKVINNKKNIYYFGYYKFKSLTQQNTRIIFLAFFYYQKLTHKK